MAKNPDKSLKQENDLFPIPSNPAPPGMYKTLAFLVQDFSHQQYPIVSMYGIFTYIDHRNPPNVGKYAIHGSYGYVC